MGGYSRKTGSRKGEHAAVEIQRFAGGFGPTEPRRLSSAGFNELGAPGGVGFQREHGVADGLRAGRVDVDRRVAADFRQAGIVAANDRRALAERFEYGHAEALVPTRENERLGPRVQPQQLPVGNVTEPLDPALGFQFDEMLFEVVAFPAAAARDAQRQRARAARPVQVQRVEQRFVVLARFQRADGQPEIIVATGQRPGSGFRCGWLVARAEEGHGPGPAAACPATRPTHGRTRGG